MGYIAVDDVRTYLLEMCPTHICTRHQDCLLTFGSNAWSGSLHKRVSARADLRQTSLQIPCNLPEVSYAQFPTGPLGV